MKKWHPTSINNHIEVETMAMDMLVVWSSKHDGFTMEFFHFC